MEADVMFPAKRCNIKPVFWLVVVVMVVFGLTATNFTYLCRDMWYLSTRNSVIDGGFSLNSIWEVIGVLVVTYSLYALAFFGVFIPGIVRFIRSEFLWIASVFTYIFSLSLSHFWIGAVSLPLLVQMLFSYLWIGISLFCVFTTTRFTPTHMSVFGALAVVELIVTLIFATFRASFHCFTSQKERSGLSPDCVTKQVAGADSAMYSWRSSLLGDTYILSWDTNSVK